LLPIFTMPVTMSHDYLPQTAGREGMAAAYASRYRCTAPYAPQGEARAVLQCRAFTYARLSFPDIFFYSFIFCF
jgi:hypothetical protein